MRHTARAVALILGGLAACGGSAHALALTLEAGFFEIAGGNIALGGWSGTAPTDRVFYSFHPADDAPETRPLLVFFNGGPGESTAILFGLNTAPVTLDPDRGGPTIAWARRRSRGERGAFSRVALPC